MIRSIPGTPIAMPEHRDPNADHAAKGGVIDREPKRDQTVRPPVSTPGGEWTRTYSRRGASRTVAIRMVRNLASLAFQKQAMDSTLADRGDAAGDKALRRMSEDGPNGLARTADRLATAATRALAIPGAPSTRCSLPCRRDERQPRPPWTSRCPSSSMRPTPPRSNASRRGPAAWEPLRPGSKKKVPEAFSPRTFLNLRW